jgi:hypothetical protein
MSRRSSDDAGDCPRTFPFLSLAADQRGAVDVPCRVILDFGAGGLYDEPFARKWKPTA